MSRFLAPVLFLCAGAGVAWFNSQHEDRVLAFPFLASLIPSLAGDLGAQGRASALLLAGIGLVLLILALLRRPPPEDPAEP